MQHPLVSRWVSGLALCGSAALLAACGGGGAADAGAPAAVRPLSISGTAAVGTALANATVQAKCLGASGQTQTGADGAYSLQLTGAQQPCVLRVRTAAGLQLHTVTQDQGMAAVANITPLTDLLLTRAAHQPAATVFDGFSPQLAANLSPAALALAQTQVVGLLNGTVDASGISSFVRTPLKASVPGNPSNDPHDQVLDRLSERVPAERFAALTQQLASKDPLPDPMAFKPELSLRNPVITLSAGESLPLVADVNYPPNVRYLRQPLSWSVVEANGGTLRTEGSSTIYTAPAEAGTYHLKVQRDDFGQVSATVTVRVTPFEPRLHVEPSDTAVVLMPGQTHWFQAHFNYQPGKAYIRPPISWQVLDAEGGSISLEGLYTAPSRPGVYRLKVQRDDFSALSFTLQVRVAAFQSLSRLSLPLQYVGLAPEQTLIRSAEAWAAWKKSRWVDSHAQPEEEVDFTRHMVAAIVWPVLSPCASAEVLDVQTVNGALQVSIQAHPAPPGVMCAAVVWNPVWLLVLPQSDLPLVVKELKEEK